MNLDTVTAAIVTDNFTRTLLTVKIQSEDSIALAESIFCSFKLLASETNISIILVEEHLFNPLGFVVAD